ncbi:MAG: NifU family protein, partial [Promethearchaeota archaeon]
DYNRTEKELTKIFEFYKEEGRKKKYDCLVPISGGKDSIYVLYLICKKYKMRPLSFTYNNGFQTDIARENIQNAVAKLGVDHIIFSPNQNELKMMYREFFRKTKQLCTVCNQMIISTIYQTAAKEDISLIIIGEVNKLERAPIYGNMRYCQEDMFKKVLEGNVPSSIYNKYTIKNLRQERKFHPLMLFDYIDYDYNTVLKVVKNELDWKEVPYGDTKVDCKFYPVIGYFKYQQNGINSKILNTSALLRDGQISRAEFHKRINKIKNFYKNMDSIEITKFLSYFGIVEKDLNNTKHVLDYVKPLVSISDFNLLNETKKKKGVGNLELIEKIIDIIRPEVIRDGGDIEILDFSDDRLKIRFLGVCNGCLHGELYIKQQIETLINRFISESIVVDIINRPEIYEWR